MINTKTLVAGSDQDKAIKLLAKSITKNLQASGYGKCQIAQFASEVIGLLSASMRDGLGEAAR